MKIMVTGSRGQLGSDVLKHLEKTDFEYIGMDRSNLDITNEEDVKRAIHGFAPDVVIHCAAYTAVDRAEEERELCYSVNVLGTKYIAEACVEIDAKLVYISTDYVFDGTGDTPFSVADSPKPINYYGKTKYEGELEIQKIMTKFFIIRISWVFGENGTNFVKTMLKLAKEKTEISVVCDQVGSPTYTDDLSKLILKIILTNYFGIYHATNNGYCSWYEFACEIFRLANIEVKVNPIQSFQYPTRAKRPLNSRLDKSSLKVFNYEGLGRWEDAIKHYISKISE